MPLTHPSMVGQTIGNYVVTELLGAGSMGEVYRAENARIARQVAIKILHPVRSVERSLVERFFDEAKAANLIRHPGIIEIFDFGFFEGRAYLIMELLAGESLGAFLRRRGPMAGELATVAVIGAQIATALEAAHVNRIVHRDLKPDNVFLVAGEPGGELRVKVLDFGVAKLSVDHRPSRTGSGDLVGTPIYMSPEQCSGAHRVDSRADIYALGCILFQMLCGRPPFVREGIGELITAHLTLEPPRPGQVQPGLPAWLDELVLSMLAKSPDQRPQRMAEVEARLLAGVSGHPVRVPPPAPRRAWLGALGLAAAGVGLAGWLVTRGPSPDRSAPAPRDPVTRAAPASTVAPTPPDAAPAPPPDVREVAPPSPDAARPAPPRAAPRPPRTAPRTERTAPPPRRPPKEFTGFDEL